MTGRYRIYEASDFGADSLLRAPGAGCPDQERGEMSDPTPLRWRKSTRSGANACVEVAFLDDQVAVRDSKHQHQAALVFTHTEWQAFLTGVRDGEFDWPDT